MLKKTYVKKNVHLHENFEINKERNKNREHGIVFTLKSKDCKLKIVYLTMDIHKQWAFINSQILFFHCLFLVKNIHILQNKPFFPIKFSCRFLCKVFIFKKCSPVQIQLHVPLSRLFNRLEKIISA